ncbi:MULTISPECIES: helix-turn-helix domain-containing protein [Flavobacterium]|uniref:helix-turn-helix domain-containing protein n=1 Tax=Flavobacterium TaxID=237 RepID=UPI001642FA2E|nr:MULTISPECIES: helix-turn-helix transcriptional regulator [Flavobacterium]MCR4032155.1 helix-turn-helix transcriptional regulator [Flavobacterium panacis]
MRTTASIYNNIKNIREFRNLTQDHMAHELGITQTAYSKIEKGKTALSLDKLERIAEILGFNLPFIINFDPEGCLKSVKEVKSDGKAGPADQNGMMIKLYQDKATLLEQLLRNSESELAFYKRKYGPLY